MTSGGPGILPDRAIAELIAAGALRLALAASDGQIQPASLDLRLGATAYRVRASFLPGPTFSVADKLHGIALHRFDLSGGAVLETGCVYIIPLLESLASTHVPPSTWWPGAVSTTFSTVTTVSLRALRAPR